MEEKKKEVFCAGYGMVSEDFAKEVKRIRSFVFNPDNVGNCSECPYNSGNSLQADRPCGQQNCWVEIATREEISE